MSSIDGTSGSEKSGQHLLMGWCETIIPFLSPYYPLLFLLTSFPLSPNRLTPDTSPPTLIFFPSLLYRSISHTHSLQYSPFLALPFDLALLSP